MCLKNKHESAKQMSENCKLNVAFIISLAFCAVILFCIPWGS